MSRFALMAEFHPAFHMRIGTPNLIRTLCSDPDHPFKAVVATDHRGPNPISGPWDALPVFSLFRPRSLIPNISIGLGLLDNISFKLQRKRVLRFLEKQVQEQGIERLFVVIANNARFATFMADLPVTLPIDLYIIDDFVADSHIYRVNKKAAQRAMDKLIKESDRVFSISPVYAQDIKKEYARDCGILPIPIPRGNLNSRDKERALKQSRKKSDITAGITLHHAGQIHHLYADAMAQMIPLLENIANSRNVPITLELWGNLDAAQVGKALNINLKNIHNEKSYFNIKLCGEAAMVDLLEAQKQSDFLMLFNSFIPSLTKQIRCSLSSKLLEYLLSGVPILLYGPDYSSLAQHLGNHNAAHIVSTDDATAAQQQMEDILFDPNRNCTTETAYTLAEEQHSTSVLYDKIKN